MRLGQPIVIYFSNINPSARKESYIDPPGFLIILMYSKLFDPFNLKTASTASFAKCSLSMLTNFELNVVFAIFNKS